jgi:glycerophosphoryl diester phosphodiesterase
MNMTHAILMLPLFAFVAAPTSEPAKCPQIIAHRGESSLAPENTMAAVELAWKRNADAVEIDVHLTADGHLVVCHDNNTQRTAGKKMVIANSTLAELRTLNMGTWNAKEQPIPLLTEVLNTIPDNKRLFVEVKVGPEAVPVLKKDFEASHKRVEQLVVLAFQPAVIVEMKRSMPGHRAFLEVGLHQNKETKRWAPTLDEVIARARAAKADGVDIRAAEPLDQLFVEKLHQAGLEVYAWTVDSPQVAARLFKFGVAGVTTNRAGWLREQLSAQSEEK